jgi:hypothetical protein
MPLSMSMKVCKDKGNAMLKKPFKASCITFVPLLGAKSLVIAIKNTRGYSGVGGVGNSNHVFVSLVSLSCQGLMHMQ